MSIVDLEPPPRIVPRDGLAVTPEEYERLVETDRRYELVDGRLHEVEVSAYSQFVASRINTRIDRFLEDHPVGYAVVGCRFRFYPDEPTRARLPDVAFISFARLGGEALPPSHIDAAPELTVEAISPTDAAVDLDVKIAEYLAHGVQQVWVARPTPRAIDVHRPDGGLTRFRTADTLTIDSGPLAGFALRVADVFPPQRDFPHTARDG